MANVPKFYNSERIGTLFYPEVHEIASQAMAAGLPSPENDDPKVMLLLVDMQIDFCHPDGTLFVPGAREDIERIIQFIYKNAEQISQITCSLDSHLPMQIFHPVWWTDENGNHPEPYTIIKTTDVKNEKWKPLFQPEWSRSYVERLQENAQKELMIWPYHVPLGGVGNILDPELWSAVFWHSIARQSQPRWLIKGNIPETEYYSMLKPEIEVEDHPQDTVKDEFVKSLRDWDQVLIAGEAESHCVLETIEDLAEIFGEQPQQMRKFYLLQDCTSPVQHPEIDFHAIAREKLEEYSQSGLQLINSTDSLPF